MTLLEFPCDFTIKIIAQNIEGIEKKITETVFLYFPETRAEDISTKLSKRDQYISFSVKLHAKDKPSLDTLYENLNKIPEVKMAL